MPQSDKNHEFTYFLSSLRSQKSVIWTESLAFQFADKSIIWLEFTAKITTTFKTQLTKNANNTHTAMLIPCVCASVGCYFMKKLFYILLIVSLNACNHSDSVINENKQIDPISKKDKPVIAELIVNTNSPQTKFSVIVLPPYDEIANAGISPDIQRYLETEISKDTSFALFKFPYKQLVGVFYQNIYDKKYCNPIVNKTKADIIIMTKLDQIARTGKMSTDKWNFQIKIYNVKADKQISSTVRGKELMDSEIQKLLSERLHDLMTEIKNNR